MTHLIIMLDDNDSVVSVNTVIPSVIKELRLSKHYGETPMKVCGCSLSPFKVEWTIDTPSGIGATVDRVINLQQILDEFLVIVANKQSKAATLVVTPTEAYITQ